MALTATQQAQIRRFLGYPDLFRYQNTRLEGAINGNLSPEAETLIIADLAQLVTIDTALTSGVGLKTAGVKKADEVEFFGAMVTINSIRSLGRTVAGRISTALGVPFGADYFGGGGYPGDTFSGALGMGSGNSNGGGPIPLG
jgi:hypothetical protein